jgi:glycosyltransferase involved in cell wall biosynthesis
VEDIRPYIAHAALVVAPLRIARGIQNKILEAMAMEKRIIATPDAIEGVPVSDQEDVVITEDPNEFSENVITFLSDLKISQKSTANRVFIEKEFGWQVCTDKLITLIG